MRKFDVIIIGSGPAGKTAAIQAAKLGRHVAIIDGMASVGGVCVHTGTIPSKTLRETVLNLTGWRERGFYGRAYRVKSDIQAADLMQRLSLTLQNEVDIQQDHLVRNGVQIVQGFAHFIDGETIGVDTSRGDTVILKAERFIIAVGTRTYRPDHVPFNGETVIDSDEVTCMQKLPRTLTVIGAGVVGVEYATIFKTLDINVTLIEPRDTMLDFMDQEILMHFRHEIVDSGLRLQFGQKVKSIETRKSGSCIVTLENNRAIASDMVLFAAGRVGNTDKLGLDSIGIEVDHRGRLAVNDRFQTSRPNIYACGDVIGFPSLASTALEQGRIAVLDALDEKSYKKPEYFPYGIYAVPEMSTVGMSEEEVIRRKIPYETGLAQLRETSRGKVMGLRSGVLKAIFSTKTRRLLGAHIVGEGATELIHIGQAVLTLKGTMDYFLENAFNYPTLAEAYKVAALHAHNRMMALEY
ncbi:MAG: Si-specific NAD(P)(+) transhydrogenase [Gammaproteobacteria bacterium]|nr:Si-specific NAD(P)(+) transhydrogenase [Gammaproteobacteria bacterium]MYD75533.1 Si-specific NAD(P)(+) transhydrogenase [Gammaproteobacteria bacterium]MYJ53215.1 Si-specific NAD(P)(+) transhydrogenase [Gammaproteobacteria bacterium]